MPPKKQERIDNFTQNTVEQEDMDQAAAAEEKKAKHELFFKWVAETREKRESGYEPADKEIPEETSMENFDAWIELRDVYGYPLVFHAINDSNVPFLEMMLKLGANAQRLGIGRGDGTADLAEKFGVIRCRSGSRPPNSAPESCSRA